MDKTSLIPIVEGYLKTLHKGSSAKICTKDIAIQIGLPIVIGIVAFVCPVVVLQVVKSMFSNAIIAVSIVSSLLCGLAIMVFQLRIQMSIMDATQKTTRAEEILVDELFSDILWSVICGFASVFLMTVSGIVLDPTIEAIDILDTILDVIAATSLAFLINFIIVTCMCLKRLNSAYIIISKVWRNN